MGIRACPSMGAPVIYDILHIFDCGNFKSEARDTPWNGMGDFDLGSKKRCSDHVPENLCENQQVVWMFQ